MSSPSPAPTPSLTAGTVTVSTPMPVPTATVVTSGGGGGGLVAAFVSGAVIAAVVGAVVNVWLAGRKSREEERARVRTTLAEAFQAYAEYKEFPYAIRRRRADAASEERVRLSESLRQVQARLSFYQAWTLAESPPTGKAYDDLIRKVREVAGSAMSDSWRAPAVKDDAGMNIGPDIVDLSALKPFEDAFIRAAETHVQAITSWKPRRKKNGTGEPAAAEPPTGS